MMDYVVKPADVIPKRAKPACSAGLCRQQDWVGVAGPRMQKVVLKLADLLHQVITLDRP